MKGKRRYIIIFLIIVCCGIYIFQNNIETNTQKNRGISNIIWYQIIPDRRANGNKKNDAVSRPLDRTNISGTYNGMSFAEARYKAGISPRNIDRFVLTDLEKKITKAYEEQMKITAGNATYSILNNRWFGGDFQGIEDHIAYLKDLGVGGILLQPVWISNSPIRYDVRDWRHIDPRLTDEFNNTTNTFEKYIQSEYSKDRSFTKSDKQFFQLIEKLHKSDIKVLIDMSLVYGSADNYLIEDVARNGSQSKYYKRFDFSDKAHKNNKQTCLLSDFYDSKKYPLTSDIYYRGRRDSVCYKINIRQVDSQYGIDEGLYKYYLDILKRWLGTNTIDGVQYKGADGIRIDAFPEFTKKTAKAIYNDIKKINPDAIIMGEKREPDVNPIEEKTLDTISFYGVRTWAEALLIQNGAGLIDGISGLLKKIAIFFKTKNVDSSVLMNYISSHDTDRLLSRLIYTNRDAATTKFRQYTIDELWKNGHWMWDSDWTSKASADANYIHSKPADIDIKLFKSVIAFQFLLPGSPVIYYGDELGMFGSDDPDNRQPMRRDIQSIFPRHICKRGPNPKEYCITDGSLENYNGDTSILDWYKTLANIKQTSKAIRDGSIDINICFGFSIGAVLCTENSSITPLIGFHRQKGSDHIIYIASVNMKQIDDKLKIKSNEKNIVWKDIQTNTLFKSDTDGMIEIGGKLKENGFLILEKIPN